MKYKDPKTGEYKDIFLKTGDTLPVGTIVEYDGDEIPAGYKEIPGVVASVVVSPTEPTTGEEVWIQTSKNKFDTRLLAQGGWNNSDNSERVVWGIKVKAGETYTISNYSQKRISIFETSNLIQSNSINSVLVEHGSLDGVGNVTITVVNDAYLRLLFSNIDNSSISVSDILPSDVQLEVGNAATNFEPFVPKRIYVENNNGYEEIYNEENLENYSFGEKRIGTWIDGKPLYRKIFKSSFSRDWSDFSISDLNADTIYINYGKTFANFTVGTANYVNGQFYASETDFFRCFISKTSKTVQVAFASQMTNREATIVVEYTKTTD